MQKNVTKIRLLKQDILLDAIVLRNKLALQLANLATRKLASQVHSFFKNAPIGNERGRPRAAEVIVRTNQKYV